MNDYGKAICDWRDKEAYPKRYDDIHENNWRWEFLRRDPQYQQAWARSVGPATAEGNIKIPAREDSYLCLNVFRTGCLVNPWGKYPLPSRHIKYDQPSGAITINAIPSVYGNDDTRGPNSVGVIFDLDRLIKPQLAEVHGILVDEQKKRHQVLIAIRKHKEKWPLYIRLLDAFSENNVGAMEIYRHLLNEAELLNSVTYDAMCVNNPATLIADWKKSATDVRDKVIRYL